MDEEGLPWYWLLMYAPVKEEVELLVNHGWRIVGDYEDYPVVLVRKRFRWFGTPMLIEVSLDRVVGPDGERAIRIDGIGWVVRDEDDVFGRFTWA